MKAKLTDTGIRSYQPRAAQYAIGDSACPGLCLRITPKGVKTFAFAYRNKGTGKVAWLAKTPCSRTACALTLLPLALLTSNTGNLSHPTHLQRCRLFGSRLHFLPA
jgi:hypothetical protein